MEKRTRYFKGVDAKGAAMVGIVNIEPGSAEEKMEAAPYALAIFGMRNAQEITAAEFKKGLKGLGKGKEEKTDD